LARLKENLFLTLLVGFNLIVKAFPAALLELGNDEVYYWTYAMFPDWCHFDHPPMVGLTIQAFSLNLLFDSEFFIRLGSLVLSSANIVILFKLVKRIYTPSAAYIAVLLFTASFYFNIIAGLMILPDTPQMFFLLLAIYFGVPSLIAECPSRKEGLNLILFGFFTGLAFLSKYHSLFVWVGVGLYILLKNRVWLKRPALYLSALTTLVLMLPAIIWNANNSFISFAFHGGRVGLLQSPLSMLSFLQFNLGQFFYQNPILFVVYVVAVVSAFRGRSKGEPITFLWIAISLPLIVIFTVVSLYRSVLPHWTGPAFIGLLILSSDWLAGQWAENRRRVAALLLSSNVLFFIVLYLAFVQVNYGVLNLGARESDPATVGRNDFTLDMYGWRQAQSKFEGFLNEEGISRGDYHHVRLVSSKWFPAAHIDYYIASPLGIQLLTVGGIENIHKYWWINRYRSLSPTDRIFYITTSQHFSDPSEFADHFVKATPKDTIPITRRGEVVKNLFVYELNGLSY